MGRVLVVEDDMELSWFVSHALEDAGHEVCVTEDVLEAAYAISKFAPDVAILDRMLPDGDGLVLTRQLTAVGSKILVFSGLGRPEEVRCASGRGIHAYVVKPFDPEALVATVEQLMSTPRDQLEREGFEIITYGYGN